MPLRESHHSNAGSPWIDCSAHFKFGGVALTEVNWEPLDSYLENLPEHFAAFNLEDRYKAEHVAKIMPCNWKLAMEAFVEAYHVASVHPQVLGYYGDTNTATPTPSTTCGRVSGT